MVNTCHRHGIAKILHVLMLSSIWEIDFSGYSGLSKLADEREGGGGGERD